MVPSLPLLFCESSVSVKENPDRKKYCLSVYVRFNQLWTWNQQSRQTEVTHLRRDTVVRTYFLCNDMCKNAWKTVFLKSGNGKAEDWRIVGNIFHLVLSYRMRKTLFVLSIMRVSERIGPNACVTRELHGTW